MIFGVEMMSFTKTMSVAVDTNKKLCVVNGLMKELKVDNFEERLLDIVVLWPKKIKGYSFVTNQPYAKVVLKNGDASDKFNFVGSFPENFTEFEKLMQEVEQC